MNSTLKISVIILTTLFIGILLGAVGHGALVEGNGKKYDRTPPSTFFLSHMEDVIKPDSSQQSRVDSITERTANRIDVLFDHHRLEMMMLLDSMKLELSTFLQPDQMERLADEIHFGEEEQHGKYDLAEAIAFSYEYAEHLQQELDLDSMQTERIMAIIHASHHSFNKNLLASNSNAQQLDSLEHILFDETSRAIQQVLTAEQKETFRKKQGELRHYAESELKEEEGRD
jgi:hypothetical protein